MKFIRAFFLTGLFFFLGSQAVSAEDRKTFCSQTCSLWPKLCASASVCMSECQTPYRLMKACRSNHIEVDSKLPDIPYTKRQFCQHVCGHATFRCSVATYCIQTCKTPPDIISRCLTSGYGVDSQRPRLQG